MTTPFDIKLTPKEQKFGLTYFHTGNRLLAMKNAGYPTGVAKGTGIADKALWHAARILQRPRMQAYLRKLWEESESPIVMSVRERKEKLSLIARGMVGDTIDEAGEIDWEAVKNMPAVKEVIIEERDFGTIPTRTIKVKLFNPVESIHELNWMENMMKASDKTVNINPVYNYYVTDAKVVEKLGQIGERTQKVIELTGKAVDDKEAA